MVRLLDRRVETKQRLSISNDLVFQKRRKNREVVEKNGESVNVYLKYLIPTK